MSQTIYISLERKCTTETTILTETQIGRISADTINQYLILVSHHPRVNIIIVLGKTLIFEILTQKQSRNTCSVDKYAWVFCLVIKGAVLPMNQIFMRCDV